jgi:hypothetical protein
MLFIWLYQQRRQPTTLTTNDSNIPNLEAKRLMLSWIMDGGYFYYSFNSASSKVRCSYHSRWRGKYKCITLLPNGQQRQHLQLF